MWNSVKPYLEWAGGAAAMYIAARLVIWGLAKLPVAGDFVKQIHAATNPDAA